MYSFQINKKLLPMKMHFFFSSAGMNEYTYNILINYKQFSMTYAIYFYSNNNNNLSMSFLCRLILLNTFFLLLLLHMQLTNFIRLWILL